MSFSLVRPYFRTNLRALGFTEWTDAFNFENIPSTRLEKAFHIENPSGSRRDVYDPTSQDIELDVTIRTFRKGFKDPAQAVDSAIADLEAILTRVLASDRRLGTGIKNVVYNNHTITPLADTNDNVAVLEINFICFIMICV